jgi:hypothetical protein
MKIIAKFILLLLIENFNQNTKKKIPCFVEMKSNNKIKSMVYQKQSL